MDSSFVLLFNNFSLITLCTYQDRCYVERTILDWRRKIPSLASLLSKLHLGLDIDQDIVEEGGSSREAKDAVFNITLRIVFQREETVLQLFKL